MTSSAFPAAASLTAWKNGSGDAATRSLAAGRRARARESCRALTVRIGSASPVSRTTSRQIAAMISGALRAGTASGAEAGAGAGAPASAPEAVPARRAPEIIAAIWREVVRLTGDADPMRTVKARQDSLALALLPAARDLVAASPDPFFHAVKLAAAGNALDVMVGVDEIPADQLLLRLAGRWVDAQQVELFRERLRGARKVVYFLDNCGEIVFDRLLLEVAGDYGPFAAPPGSRPPEVMVVARSLPVLNDATVSEALGVGLGEVARVVGNGIEAALPGTVLD